MLPAALPGLATRGEQPVAEEFAEPCQLPVVLLIFMCPLNQRLLGECRIGIADG